MRRRSASVSDDYSVVGNGITESEIKEVLAKNERRRNRK
jgi:hypothetical protein